MTPIKLAESAFTDFQQDLVVAAAGAAIGFLGAFLIEYLRTRREPRKRLSWEAKTRTTVVSVDPDFRSHIRISYSGTEVEDLASIKFDVENTGNRVVRNHRLRFNFPEGCHILESQVSPEPEPELGVRRTPEHETSDREAAYSISHLERGQSVGFRLVAAGSIASDWKVVSHNEEGDVEFQERTTGRAKEDSEHIPTFFILTFLMLAVPPVYSTIEGAGSALSSIFRGAFLAALIPHLAPTARTIKGLAAAWQNEQNGINLTSNGKDNTIIHQANGGYIREVKIGSNVPQSEDSPAQ